MFTQLSISHQNPEVTCSLLTPLPLPQLTFYQRFLFAGRLFFFFCKEGVVVGLNADCPLLSSAGSLFLPLPLGSPPHSALPLLGAPLFSSPSPALASNGLNRLAPCQSRGLLWLCHKSARKNRNHLFRPGPERGWGCKYMSLALALGPACAHRTTEPQWRILHSHSVSTCTPTSYYSVINSSFIVNLIHSTSYKYI